MYHPDISRWRAALDRFLAKPGYRAGFAGIPVSWFILGPQMITQSTILVTILLWSTAATAADLCPATSPGAEWAATCFETDHASRRVKRPYIKHLRPNDQGYATVIISEPRELVAIDRDGKVVVPGIVHTGDFDFPTAHGGVGRFITRKNLPGNRTAPQCGYFDSASFRVVIPAEYDHCKPFADGEAIACKHCQSHCVDPDCHDSVLTGGEGVALALDGTVRRRFKLREPTPKCAQPRSEQVSGTLEARPDLRCASDTQDPFNQLK
jgi:hypothetical protein